MCFLQWSSRELLQRKCKERERTIEEDGRCHGSSSSFSSVILALQERDIYIYAGECRGGGIAQVICQAPEGGFLVTSRGCRPCCKHAEKVWASGMDSRKNLQNELF